VVEEIGLAASLGETLGKLMSGKKDELIKAILAVEGFVYTNKIPGHLKYDQ